MQNRKPLVLVSVLLALLGCDDEDSGGGGASSAKICEHVCARAALAHCQNDTPNCANKCVSVRDDSPVDCDRELDAFTHCALRATFTCDANRESEASGCQALMNAWTSCYVGGASHADAGGPSLPSNQDGSVPTTSTADAGSTPATDGGVTAQPDAGAPARNDGGAATQSDAGAATQSDAGPVTQRDAGRPAVDSGVLGALLCAPEPDDEACDSCLKTGCCTEIQECGADCIALGSCIAEPSCLTDQCFAACYAASPNGAAQFDALTECLASSCSAECTD